MIHFDDYHVDKKIKRITCVKLGEERFAIDNKKMIARATLKKAVIKILIKIQAYKHCEKLKRIDQSKVKLTRMLKIEDEDDDRDIDESSIEDYDNADS